MKRLPGLTLTLVICVFLLISGCDMSQTMVVKNALSDFDANFEIRCTPGLSIVFRHPTLSSSDMLALEQFHPTAIIPSGNSEIWIYDFQKDIASDKNDSLRELTIYAHMENDRLESLVFPDKFHENLDINFLKSALSATGKGRVNLLDYSIEGRWHPENVMLYRKAPAKSDLESMLGKPVMEYRDFLNIHSRYDYTLTTTENGSGGSARISFEYGSDNRLLKVEGQVDDMKVILQLN